MSPAEFKSLPSTLLASGAGYHQPGGHGQRKVSANSPALEVMTDLALVPAATIDAQTHMDVAHQAMMARGVRSLLVTDSSSSVVGLLTARDILGERPMQVVQRQGIRHGEIRVQDIMTPAKSIEVLALADVMRAKVGHIVETLKTSGRQHALVVDADPHTHRQLIRGVFSASQIARQMGVSMPTPEIATTFAEIEAVIAGEPA